MHCLRQCGIDKLRSTRNETWRWWSENYQKKFFWKILLSSHSSEIWGLLTTKFSSKMLQNFLYFMYKKPSIVFWVFFISSNFTFSLKNALVYVDKYYRWPHLQHYPEREALVWVVFSENSVPKQFLSAVLLLKAPIENKQNTSKQVKFLSIPMWGLYINPVLGIGVNIWAWFSIYT